jgi:ABC-type oligopeptide transport system substrate-binding subunit
MKKVIALLAIVGFFAACNNAGKTSTTDSTTVVKDSVNTTTVDTTKTADSTKTIDTTKH